MQRALRTCIALACLLPGAATAQLPPVLPPGMPAELPQLPERVPRGLPPLAGGQPAVGLPLRDAVEGLPKVVPAALRRQARELLRRHPRELERDPRGAPIMRAVVIALSPDAAALQRAQGRGYVIQEDRELPELQQRIVTLLVPAGTATDAALRELRAEDPTGQYDFDHLYVESATAPAVASTAQPLAQPPPGAPVSVRVGLVDGGVDSAHPVFRHRPPQVSGCGGLGVPSAHGTAVASLFVGWSDDFIGAAPGAQLLAVNVYCGQQSPGGRMRDVVAGLADLAAAQTRIINLSIVGPDNSVLAAVVRAVQARKVVLVAAAGNDGPNAAPLYPAAYPGVIAVTGVDARARVLAEAGSGEHISFAAPAADMLAAAPDGKFATVRGTSFAAPLVAGMLAMELAHNVDADREQLFQRLAATAEDRGAKGRDRRYGLGLVGGGLRVDPLTWMGRQMSQPTHKTR